MCLSAEQKAGRRAGECACLRVSWGPGRGWGPGPFDLPACLGAGNSPGLTLAGALPTLCSWRWGWGGWGGGCLPWLPRLAVPQLPSLHALTLPGTPGLRSGAASSGCQASFSSSEGSCPPEETSGPCTQENPHPALTLPHQEEPLAPSRCPGKSPLRALHPGAGQRLNFLTLHPPSARKGPISPHCPRQCQREARVPFPVTQHRG